MTDATPSLSQQVADLASQCVRCGLCLPKCPTYQLQRREADSPRGRIALLAALAAGELSANDSVTLPIDQCLSCRFCESACPADVHYESLLIKGRALIHQQSPTQKPLGLLLTLLTLAPRWRRYLFSAYHLAKRFGLLRVAQSVSLTGLLKWDRALAYIPPTLAKPFINKLFYPAPQPRGTVALLIGCSSDVLEPQTINDAITLLNHWGFSVRIPAGQTCCGALHAHAGLMDRARHFEHKNQAALLACHQQHPLDAIVNLTTGCASTWQHYQNLPHKIIDIQRFLIDQWPAHLQLAPLDQRIAVHEPCSQRNGLAEDSLSLALLKKIPQLQCIAFGQNTCCGAAGDYFLKHATISDQLGQKIAGELTFANFSGIVSANLGCRLQLEKQLVIKKSQAIPFYHPISLLALALPATTVQSSRH